MRFNELERGKDYNIVDLLDIFGPFNLANRITRGDFFKTNKDLSNYQVT